MARRTRRSKKGVSPVLATLILIVIAVIAGLVVYWWVYGQLRWRLWGATKELKIMNVWFQKTSWNKNDVGDTADSGTKTYTLGYWWYEGYNMHIYVYDKNGVEHELSISGNNLYYNGKDVGDINRYSPWEITINYTALEVDAGLGDVFTGAEDVKITVDWYRIELRIKNTGQVDVSITKLWVGYSADCPWDWSGYVKFTSLPYTITAGSEIRFYISRSWTGGKSYYFKFEVDGEYLGPYGPYQA